MSSSSQPRLFWSSDVSSRSGGKAHSVKLLDMQKGKLLVAPEGTQLLRSLPTAEKLNLVFVFGNARSGKSFLMNALSGCGGLFQVMNSSQPCTKGVDISSAFVPHLRLEQHAKSLAVSPDDIVLTEAKTALQAEVAKAPTAKKGDSALQVGWVDVEGQGAEDNSYDTALALPLLLTSKVCLFNHKGAPTVSDMLSRLGVLARAAEYIDIGDSGESAPGEVTDSDDDSTKTTTTFASQRASGGGPKFGHLHVCFRDFSFDGSPADVYQQLLGLEVVPGVKSSKGTKSLNQKSDRDREQDAVKAIQERNDIRNLLHENFASIHVWLFKQPASADNLKAHRDLPEELVDPEFTSEVHRLTQVLTLQLKTPTMFSGTYLNGVKISTLLQQITTSLNTSGGISVPSVFKAMENETVNRVFKEVVAEWEARTEKIKKSLPINQASLNAQLSVSASKALDRFDDDLSDCVLLEERAKRREDLLTSAARAKESLTTENHELLLKLLRKVVLEATSTTKANFESFCVKVIPIDESRALELEFAKERTKHTASIKEALKDHAEAFDLAEYRFAALEADETLTEFLSFKLVQNEAQVKDEKITRLQEEAIAQQQLLIQQNKRLEEFLDEEKKNTRDMEAELARLRVDREEEKARAAAEKEKMDKLAAELADVRKKKKSCVIL